MWAHSQTAGLDGGAAAADRHADDITASRGQYQDKVQAALFPSKNLKVINPATVWPPFITLAMTSWGGRLICFLSPYLGVRLGDLLVQTLVAVDGELQLLHLRR